ncbi:MAG: diacylglycerol kinase family protein [Gemmatimonadota bacterium]
MRSAAAGWESSSALIRRRSSGSRGCGRCPASPDPGRAGGPLLVWLIYNPVSGRGAGARSAARAAAAFAAAGHRVEQAATSPPAGAAVAARTAIAEGADRLVAIGGDGTVAQVAAGILAADRTVPLALLPQGTANVLALNLGLPRTPGAAIATAMEGVTVRLDCGVLDGVPFLMSAGTGLLAGIVARADRTAKQRWGLAAYGLAGWSAGREAVPVRYALTCDGQTEELDATMIHVMNCGAIFRRRWEFAPGISPVDGLLDVLAYRVATLPQYLTAATAIVRGAPTATDLVVHRRATRVTLAATPPAPVQRDGELAGETLAEISVLPAALPVIVPAWSPWVAAQGSRP